MSNESIIGFLVTVAAFWHVLGFAFGLVYIHLSLKSLIGTIPYDRQWSKTIRMSDLHLWLSGISLMALGVSQVGFAVFMSNPKLLSKLTVVCVWCLSTQLMRWYAIPRLKQGSRQPMLFLSAINISCWVYGAILGCAKPLANVGTPYAWFMAGFLITMALCFWAVSKLANIPKT